jgi:hypothetical protein
MRTFLAILVLILLAGFVYTCAHGQGFQLSSTYMFYPLGNMQQDYSAGISNAFQIQRTPMDGAISSWAASNNVGLVFCMPASVSVMSGIGGWSSPSEALIASEYNKLLPMKNVWWELMSEYDQSGGHWVAGRVMDYTSRQTAYNSWRNSLLNNYSPLGTYLQMTPKVVPLAALNVYSYDVHYSYEMGIDLVILERTNDELGDIQTGIAFVRGAGSQYGKPWGIDISTWRAATQTPTEYDGNGKLLWGWSGSYFRRNMYIAYMSGANTIQIEPCVRGGNRPGTIGAVTEEIADFSLRRHKDVGKPVVPVALMLDFNHGFEPKFGRYCQADYVWYWRIPYSQADRLTHEFLNLAFPGYWKSGTLPGAPQTPESYIAALASGQDPRPWEPMAESRWGDQLDVILSNAPIEVLRKYKVIVTPGSGTPVLSQWIAEGGKHISLPSTPDELDAAIKPFIPAFVTGSPIEYIVNRRGEDVIVTLVNNYATTWTGIATAPGMAARSELISDTPAGSTLTVEPYDLKIIQFSPVQSVDRYLKARK